jgi:hypothetical protein
VSPAGDGFTIYGLPVRGRSCASCKLCCTLVPVELDDGWSKAGEACKHLCSKGCGIYPKRPSSCRYWSCRWLFDPATLGLRRPDQVHYLIDAMPDQIRLTYDDGEAHMIDVVQVWVDPRHRGAWRDQPLLDYLDALGRTHRMAAILRFSSTDCLVLFPPSVSADGKWHEKSGSMSTEIGNHSAHPMGGRPPL